ncbi:c-type cytochrome [Halobacteriovorax sp. GB3]|uniref:c-type cytochrome n=1 Tax=Halobacteriovorax sp. GB3 TaxID=2719615 RepID=UPI002360C2F4|nr:c-type cytochrome [Halobacteriovorax sp. GB3]MDD0854516.1 c-type cytochrome [Halobacteriovorax sp. GB3]
MRRANKLFIGLGLISTLVGCSEKHFLEDKVFAGGIVAEAKVLNKGKSIYTEYCMACHGVKGDGKGVAAKGLQVPPRDFTKGIFKFGEVVTGELPHDKHFYKILEKGLHGTAMLPWDLTEDQMFAVVSYIKTFAPQVWEGKDKELGTQIVVTKDPYGPAHKNSAIQRGKEVFHTVAQCQSCHRAYVSKDEFIEISKKVNGENLTHADIDRSMYQVKLQETEWGFKSLPPEFTWDEVRSATTVEELYIRLNAGIGGTAMPSWKETISDEDIWAVSHYVKYLMDMKNKPERKAFMDAIGN